MFAGQQHSRPLSADLSATTRKPSMLNSILPSAVQTRLPRLSSLRRSVSMYALGRGKESDSTLGVGSRNSDMAMVLSGKGRAEETGYESESPSSDEDLTKLGFANDVRQVELTEKGSGISWKFANQGLNLLSLTVQESAEISRDARFGNPTFARQLYLHAITYLLRALPSDLTTEEQLSVRSALPVGVVEPLQLKASEVGALPRGSGHSDLPPSLLHRVLASTIVQMFLLLQFMLPYVKYFLSAAYRYEREHKISEKVFSQSIETVDSIGKRSLSITGTIYGMGNGKVGQIIGDMTAWVLDGITGGIHEGIGEGMLLVGARRPSSSHSGGAN